MNIRDAATLRLQVLKDDLEPVIEARREAESFIDLALVPGDPPRLWIDMLAYVLMAPDPRTYRLCQDSASGQRVLLETTDRAEMADRITSYVAHRVIDRQRHLVEPTRDIRPARRAYGWGALLLAWLSGVILGALTFVLIWLWLL